jgi:hypothetical protein
MNVTRAHLHPVADADIREPACELERGIAEWVVLGNVHESRRQAGEIIDVDG